MSSSSRRNGEWVKVDPWLHARSVEFTVRGRLRGPEECEWQLDILADVNVLQEVGSDGPWEFVVKYRDTASSQYSKIRRADFPGVIAAKQAADRMLRRLIEESVARELEIHDV